MVLFFCKSDTNALVMKYHCLMDGFPFDHAPICIPVAYDSMRQKFTFEKKTFCSPSCAKGYLYRDISTSSDRLHLFALYCKKMLHMDVVTTCPDPSCITSYNIDGVGMSISDFRAKSGTSSYISVPKQVSFENLLEVQEIPINVE